MTGKKMIFCVAMVLISINIYSQSMTLDEAIKTTASELGQQINAHRIPNISSSNQSIEQTAEEIRRQLTAQTKIAVLNFSSDWRELSAYVIDELNNAIVRGGSLTVVDRQQLDLVRQEQNFQMSGDVDDKSAQSAGKLLGAQSVLSGSFTEIGKTYRFRIRVIAVETGVVQYSNSIEIKNDRVLTALTSDTKGANGPKENTDYNFGARLGIGLLNIPLGLGSIIFDQDKSWKFSILYIELGAAALGLWCGFFAALPEEDWEITKKWTVIGTLAGYGIGAIIGFGRAFFMHKPGYRTAQTFPVDINIVPVSSNNLGVRMVYKLSF
jgi:TolB-like protein